MSKNFNHCYLTLIMSCKLYYTTHVLYHRFDWIKLSRKLLGRAARPIAVWGGLRLSIRLFNWILKRSFQMIKIAFDVSDWNNPKLSKCFPRWIHSAVYEKYHITSEDNRAFCNSQIIPLVDEPLSLNNFWKTDYIFAL